MIEVITIIVLIVRLYHAVFMCFSAVGLICLLVSMLVSDDRENEDVNSDSHGV